jgi:hypothetical protein
MDRKRKEIGTPESIRVYLWFLAYALAIETKRTGWTASFITAEGHHNMAPLADAQRCSHRASSPVFVAVRWADLEPPEEHQSYQQHEKAHDGKAPADAKEIPELIVGRCDHQNVYRMGNRREEE